MQSTTVARPAPKQGTTTVVPSSEASAFLASLPAGPYGLDCETVGCNPKEQSPVGTASIVCWTLAWVDDSLGLHPETGTPLTSTAFFWADTLTDPTVISFLETASLVGHNIFSYDRHAFANHGIKLGNIVADTLRMAKLLDASSTDNSLKSWIRRAFNYGVGSYEELFTRPKAGPVGPDGPCRSTWRKLDGERVPTLVGGVSQRFYATRELIPLDTLARDYPDRVPLLYEYAALDAKGTLELYFLLRRRLESTPWRGLGQGSDWGNLWEFYERLWHPSLYVLWDIERNGIQYDSKLADTGAAAARVAANAAAERAYSWIGQEINLDSPKQLGAVLYRDRFFEIPPVMGTLKAIKANRNLLETTSEAALTWLQGQCSEVVDREGLGAILEQRKLTDLVQFLERLPTFCDSVSRIHSVFQPSTRTGRLSSSKPNTQQIPKDDTYGLRSAFVAAPGHVLCVADYAQLEPRITAHFLISFFKDFSLLEAINTGDVYSGIALQVWPEVFAGWSAEAVKEHKLRSEAKVVLLAKAYGKGIQGMALQLRKSFHETKAIVQRIEDAFPGMVRFQRYMAEYARSHGGVHTLLGRYRPLPDIRSKERSRRSAAERQAMNSPIQGSAADIVTAAMIKLNPRVKLVLQVHDEILVEVPEGKADEQLQLVKDLMENPVSAGLLKVPLVVEAKIGSTWQEGK